MKIYHNEIDPHCCEVLERQFPDSVVDRRSIEDVQPKEIADYPQCHFFAGIGGFSEAFRRAGVGPDRNVWTGGFPCQDLSVAGKRAGLAGSRSGLFFHFQRLVAQSRPALVIAENVPGLLSSNGGRDFAVVLGGFTGIIPGVPDGGWGSAGFLRGRVYSVAYRVFDAQYFGVAQRRRRVFIVASLGTGRAAEILFESEMLPWDPRSSRKEQQESAADAGQRLETGWDHQRLRIHDAGKAAPTLSQSDGKGGQRTPIVAFAQNTRDEVRLINGDGQIAGALAAQPGMKQQNYVLAHGQGNAEIGEDVCPTLSLNHEAPIAFTSKDDGRDATDNLSPTLRAQNFDKSHMNGEGQVAIAFRTNQTGAHGRIYSEGATDTLASDHPSAIAFTERTRKSGRNLETQEELAYALTNPGSGGRAHSRSIAVLSDLPEGESATAGNGMIVRRLMPVECERLQGYADGWTEGQSDTIRYRQLGNSVAVPNVEWIARRI